MSGEALKDGDGDAVPVQPVQQEGLFDLRILFRQIWRWKWVVLLFAVIGAAKGVNDARNFSPSYEAQMTIAPKAEESFNIPATGGGGLLQKAQSFGIISRGSVAATSFDYFKQILGSRSLADVLQEKHGLLQRVYKGSWDEANKTWIKPQIDETSIRQRLRRFFHFNPPLVPDRRRLAKYVGGAVKFEAMKKSPFFKLSVVHSDRDFALYLLETVYVEADALLAAQSRRGQARNKMYLQAQLEKAQLTEVRTALLAVLMRFEQTAMLANSEPPYMIKVLEKPWVASQPKEPKLMRTIAIPAIVATLLSLVILTLFISFRIE